MHEGAYTQTSSMTSSDSAAGRLKRGTLACRREESCGGALCGAQRSLNPVGVGPEVHSGLDNECVPPMVSQQRHIPWAVHVIGPPLLYPVL